MKSDSRLEIWTCRGEPEGSEKRAKGRNVGGLGLSSKWERPSVQNEREHVGDDCDKKGCKKKGNSTHGRLLREACRGGRGGIEALPATRPAQLPRLTLLWTSVIDELGKNDPPLQLVSALWFSFHCPASCNSKLSCLSPESPFVAMMLSRAARPAIGGANAALSRYVTTALPKPTGGRLS